MTIDELIIKLQELKQQGYGSNDIHMEYGRLTNVEFMFGIIMFCAENDNTK